MATLSHDRTQGTAKDFYFNNAVIKTSSGIHKTNLNFYLNIRTSVFNETSALLIKSAIQV